MKCCTADGPLLTQLHTCTLPRLSLSLISVSDMIPRLLAITIYVKAVTQTLGQTLRETSQPSVPPLPFSSSQTSLGLYLDCISSERVQCQSSLLP